MVAVLVALSLAIGANGSLLGGALLFIATIAIDDTLSHILDFGRSHTYILIIVFFITVVVVLTILTILFITQLINLVLYRFALLCFSLIIASSLA